MSEVTAFGCLYQERPRELSSARLSDTPTSLEHIEGGNGSLPRNPTVQKESGASQQHDVEAGKSNTLKPDEHNFRSLESTVAIEIQSNGHMNYVGSAPHARLGEFYQSLPTREHIPIRLVLVDVKEPAQFEKAGLRPELNYQNAKEDLGPTAQVHQYQ